MIEKFRIVVESASYFRNLEAGWRETSFRDLRLGSKGMSFDIVIKVSERVQREMQPFEKHWDKRKL